MEIGKLLEIKRDHILRTATKHGARNVRVFGSVARGEAGPASDVDFLVKMDQGRSLLDLSAFVVDLRDLRFSPFFRPWSSLKKNLPEMTNRQEPDFVDYHPLIIAESKSARSGPQPNSTTTSTSPTSDKLSSSSGSP